MVATALQPTLPGSSSTSTTAGTTNAAQASTLETLGTQPTASEQQRVSDLRQQFQQQAQQDPAGFRTAMREAFGDKASLAQIDQLLDMALAGKLPMPSNIQFVEAGSLGSDALGAYDANNGGSLYLDRSLLSDPTKLQSVFNEEMGHHLDALLGGADAAGDEGAVFSRTLEQGTLSHSELTALKSEDDHGVIQVGGRWVQVEFNQDGADEADSDSEDTSSSEDSGGGECSVDSGGGNTSGGASESQSDADTDSGGTDSSDTGGECSIGGDDGDKGTQDPYESDNKDDNNDHQNGNSDTDRARDTQGPNATGGPAGDEEAAQSETTLGTPPDEDTEPAPEPEPEKKGFWSRALDVVQTGLDVAGFIPGLGAVPDLVNAGISLARGDKGRAAESALAAIPFGGDAFKAGKMGMRAADRISIAKGAFSNVAPATTKQLQKKFKHAEDFGVSGNYNPNNAKKFNQAIREHMNAPGTKEISGTYRGNPVTFHTDPNSGLTVIQNSNGSFLSGWKLNSQQLQHVVKDGKL